MSNIEGFVGVIKKLNTVAAQNKVHFLFGDFPKSVHYFGPAISEIFQKVCLILVCRV